jgi:hypothetical protein
MCTRALKPRVSASATRYLTGSGRAAKLNPKRFSDRAHFEMKAEIAVTREESPTGSARRVAFAIALAQHAEPAPAMVEMQGG